MPSGIMHPRRPQPRIKHARQAKSVDNTFIDRLHAKGHPHSLCCRPQPHSTCCSPPRPAFSSYLKVDPETLSSDDKPSMHAYPAETSPPSVSSYARALGSSCDYPNATHSRIDDKDHNSEAARATSSPTKKQHNGARPRW